MDAVEIELEKQVAEGLLIQGSCLLTPTWVI